MNFKKIITVVILIIALFLLIRLIINPAFLIKNLPNIWDVDIENTLAINKWLKSALLLIIGYGTYYFYINIASFKRANINKAIAVFVIGGITLYFLLYFLTDDYNYGPDGPLKCCAQNIAQEYEYVSCDWKVHPKSGKKAVPCTDVMHRTIKNISEQQIQRVGFNQNTIFFSKSNVPLIWYYKRNDGRYELFNNEGYHPHLGYKLLPITSDVASEIINYFDKNEIEKILFEPNTKDETPNTDPISIEPKRETTVENYPYINKSNKVDVAVYISQNNRFDERFSNTLSQSFLSKFSSTTGLFGYKDLSSNYFNLLSAKDKDFINKLSLSNYANYLCIGRIDLANSKNELREDMTKSSINLSIKIIDLKTLNTVNQINKIITGTGFNQIQSEQNAIDKAVSYIKENSL